MLIRAVRAVLLALWRVAAVAFGVAGQIIPERKMLRGDGPAVDSPSADQGSAEVLATRPSDAGR